MVCETANPRVEITILGNPYAKHGTSIAGRLIIFDKGWAGPTERLTAQSIEEAEALVAAVPPRLVVPEPEPPAPAVIPLRPRRAMMSSPSTIFGGIQKRALVAPDRIRSEEHTSELQSLMRISYAVFCLKQKKNAHKTCILTPNTNEHCNIDT